MYEIWQALGCQLAMSSICGGSSTFCGEEMSYSTTFRVDRKTVTAVLQIVLLVMCETLVLVSTKAAVFLDVISHDIVTIPHAFITAKTVMVIYLRLSSHIPIAKFGRVDIKLLKTTYSWRRRECTRKDIQD